MKDEKIIKQELEYWLEDNWKNWLPDVLLSLINDDKPNALKDLRKEIKKATQDSKDAQ